MQRLLGACSRRGVAGIRDRALFVVLWRGGLRISEALALRPCDVFVDRGELAVLHGKGDRSRIVGIDPLAMAVLERWMVRRRRLLGLARDGAGALFCTISQPRPGGRMSATAARASIKRAAARAGIAKRVHPHGLRHTHAAELALEGVPIHVVRRQLGHAALNTTARYIDHLAPRDVSEAMRSRPPWPAPPS